MMKQLLPEEHLMLASAQRVKALILEEIALENIPGTSNESREFKLSCLRKCRSSLARIITLYRKCFEICVIWQLMAMALMVSDMGTHRHNYPGKGPGSKYLKPTTYCYCLS